MSNEKSTTPSVRKVVVDIATHDDDGNPITDDMLSSGGARDHGPIVKQYTNPQPYQQAPVRSDEDRELTAHMQREADRQYRSAVEVEERRRRETHEFIAAVLQPVLDGAERLVREFVRRKWDERKTRKLALRESQAVSSAVGDSSTDEPAVVVAGSGVGIVGPVTVENIAVAPVVKIEDYRRSA